ncbi:MAG: hypothetical protein HY445_03635 [Candidatus Niyogibacteria bacterium]|nr:hypothetical protein [Candidatus Niyogibacteria bacterium]
MPKERIFIPAGDFGDIIHEVAQQYGGYVNAHAHLDRSGTLNPCYLEHYGITPLEASHATLKEKQNLTGELHVGKAYQIDDLKSRIGRYVEEAATLGSKEIVSFIDATPDVGFRAIDAAESIRATYETGIAMRLIAHPIFGFKFQERWDHFVEACKRVHAVGALPEKDDRPDSIGFREHLVSVLQLGISLSKEVHVHVDQENHPLQEHTFKVFKALYGLKGPVIENHEGPTVWLIHVISPSAYSENRFSEILEGLKEYNIGVVCCPRAAVSMRQLRSVRGPIHNSIARILEMILYDIPVRIGTDNIADMFVPTGSTSMLNELLFLADAIRFYDPIILAKLGAGVAFNETDKETIRRHLREEQKVLKAEDSSFKFCVPLD